MYNLIQHFIIILIILITDPDTHHYNTHSLHARYTLAKRFTQNAESGFRETLHAFPELLNGLHKTLNGLYKRFIWTVYISHTRRFARFEHALTFVSIGYSRIFSLMVRVVLKWLDIIEKLIFDKYTFFLKSTILKIYLNKFSEKLFITEIKQNFYRTCTYMYSSLKRNNNHSFWCRKNENVP